ncbi:hypothetical protein [Seleniivibrio sp.]|uniref:hypothetical protein n=1 Tax=Seleniivibrio sp. TaxID=2898801 RepID=UPI0025D9AC3C|nr:hypothetical protein [Seleniivibrio sp.]MCD8554908.1 hypothetical protein [Seleniivibrio sp.]
MFNTWEEVNDPNRPVYNWQSNKIQPGDIRYKDVNGDGIIDNDDSVPIGYSNFPEKIFGFSFGGAYKGFDFSVLFQGAANVSVQYSRRYIMGFAEGANAPDYLIESWSQQRYEKGLPINYPHFSAGDNSSNYQNSTFWTRDASYLRLKNAEIGYTLPDKVLRKIGISYARIYLNGSNLTTWDDMLPGADPESTATGEINVEPYPVTRTFNMGVNVKF